MKRILAALIAVLALLTTALMGGCSCSGNDTPVPLAIDNHRGVVISLQHPSSFTYNEGKAGYGILGQDAITHNGTLQGEYDISFNCCRRCFTGKSCSRPIVFMPLRSCLNNRCDDIQMECVAVVDLF